MARPTRRGCSPLVRQVPRIQMCKEHRMYEGSGTVLSTLRVHAGQVFVTTRDSGRNSRHKDGRGADLLHRP